MHWQDILSIILPLGAFIAWIYGRVDKRFDHVDGQFKEVKDEIKDLRKDVQALESRVSHIEGQLMRMNPYEPRWEPKVKGDERT